jgi:hypothetical protein
MNTNILVTASALSDQDLLARLQMFAGKEREASVELVAHLAALDSRAVLYAAQGYGSLFTYCTQALRLSEDAACNRIDAARACRRFPLILDLLASGSLTLTSVRLLAKHSRRRTTSPSSQGRCTRRGARSKRWLPSWRRGPTSRAPCGGSHAAPRRDSRPQGRHLGQALGLGSRLAPRPGPRRTLPPNRARTLPSDLGRTLRPGWR